MGKKLIRLEYNGFHGHTYAAFRVPGGAKTGDRVEVSARVATRLNRAVCPGGDCECGERIASPDFITRGLEPARWWVVLPHANGKMRGNYPQA